MAHHSSAYWKDYDTVPNTPLIPSKKRAYRKTLPGQTCHFCEAYYGLSKTCNETSRHRGEIRSRTPEGFWDLDFPSPEECVRKGYIHEEEYRMPPLESNKYYISEPQRASNRKEYPAEWDDLWKWCLKMHYIENRHHPEHFENPDKEMTLDDRMELTCDLLGTVRGHALHQGIDLNLAECRAVIEHEKWDKWAKFALTEHLPPASKEIPILPPRWKTFPAKEKEILREAYGRLKAGENVTVIKRELLQLESISYYKRDLKFHKIGIEQIWNEIPQFQTADMEFRISSHDQDKFKLEMIIGYTSKWCF